MTSRPFWLPLFAAWGVALAATLGALFVGEVLGQTPCSLCWYQRICMFPLVAILGIGAYRADPAALLYAAPLAAAGALIAAFHNLLYFGIIPEAIEPCGKGPSCKSAAMTIFGGIPLPSVALVAFAAILILLFIGYRRTSR